MTHTMISISPLTKETFKKYKNDKSLQRKNENY